jgi:hypothetical protein
MFIIKTLHMSGAQKQILITVYSHVADHVEIISVIKIHLFLYNTRSTMKQMERTLFC